MSAAIDPIFIPGPPSFFLNFPPTIVYRRTAYAFSSRDKAHRWLEVSLVLVMKERTQIIESNLVDNFHLTSRLRANCNKFRKSGVDSLVERLEVVYKFKLEGGTG